MSDGDIFGIALAQIQTAVKAMVAEGARIEAGSRSSAIHLANLQDTHRQLTSDIDRLRDEVKAARAEIGSAKTQANEIIAEARKEAAVLRGEGARGADAALAAVRDRAEAETARAKLSLADLENSISAKKAALADILAETAAAQGNLQAVRGQIRKLVSQT